MEMATTTPTSQNSRYPFTSIQWQQLEHQALIYKYMISGTPIPPDLLFSIQTSFDASTRLIVHHQSPHHQSLGWNCFQMGFGRKIDPEPGRCRRTDGKKWRCSKEAYPDSKYCERHMHRGRNRSRKPVEVTNSTPAPLSMCTTKPHSHNYPSPSSQSHPPFLYPQSSRSPGNVLSSQDRFLLESSPYYSHSEKDNSCGMKEEVGEVGSGTMSDSVADSSWHLAMNHSSSLLQSKQPTLSDYQNGYLYLHHKQQQQQQQQQGCCYDHLDMQIERKDEPQKVIHHFFDESPHNVNDDDHNKDSSKTQLSISVAHDFFLTNNDKRGFE